MPTYTASQKAIIGRIKKIGRARGASPKEIKAALETGAVESNFANLSGGDADSAGWRQERASLYKNPTNLDASINRFYDETAKVKHKYGNAGALAAAVQRPAAQYRGRYQERSGEAQALLGQPTPTGGGPYGNGTLQRSATGADPEAGRAELLQQYVLQRGRPGALAQLAGGLSDLRTAAQAQPGTAPPVQPASSNAAPTGDGGVGVFKITGPNPGRVKPQVRTFVSQIAGLYGKPLVGSDGTGHSYRSATGGVSQHSSGNATDIPASGKELLRMGRAALIAAGMPRAQAMREQGGLYNINGKQIIFHDRKQVSGSPHADHLHVGVR